jgi:hypothetical protein
MFALERARHACARKKTRSREIEDEINRLVVGNDAPDEAPEIVRR